MEIICTNCSASKDPSEGLIPAYKRYISSRIVHVQEIADASNIQFCILSGKFGLVDWNELLPWYDHLLLPNEVPGLSLTIQEQLLSKGITKVNYYSRSPLEDPNLKSYIDLIEDACHKRDILIEIYLLPENKVGSKIRNWKDIMEKAADAGEVMVKDMNKGVQDFNKLLTLYPGDGMIYFQRAMAYEKLAKYAEATKDNNEAYKLFPLPRWKHEAEIANDRIEEKLSTSGVLAEARMRIKHFRKLNEALKRYFLQTIEKVPSYPSSAAVDLRKIAEHITRPMLLRNLDDKATLYEIIKNLLQTNQIPELIESHLHTIRIIGDQGAHDLKTGNKIITVRDVYPAVTAMIAILEWLDAKRK